MKNELHKTLQLISVRWWNASAYYGVSLAKGLNDTQVLSYVGGRDTSPPIQKAKELNLPIFTEINLESKNPLRFIKNLRHLVRFIAQQSIPLINAHRPEDHLYAGLLKKYFLPNVRLIRTCSDVRAPRDNPVNRWLHGAITDYFIFSCRANLERYKNVWDIFEGRSTIIYGGIDTRYFSPESVSSTLRSQLGIGPDITVIGLIGRLSPTKDHETFLRACALVNQKRAATRFIISGEEVELKFTDLQHLANQLGIAHAVVFMEKQPDVRTILQILDIGVVSSSGSEAVSRVTMEFLSMGKPVVVTDVNVLPELVEEGQTGFVVPKKYPEALAQKLIHLIDNRELLRKMGENAREYAIRNLSMETFVHHTMEVYLNVLKM